MKLRLAGLLAAIVALCVLAGFLTYRASRDGTVGHETLTSDTTPATVGTVYAGFPDDPRPSVASVRTPLGTLHATVYRRYDTVEGDPDSSSSDDGGTYTAPRGGSLVGVQTDLDTSTSVIPQRTYTIGNPQQTLSTSLVAGGRTYPLAGSSSRPVAVAGNGADLALDVTFDGVTQRVDLATGKVTEGRAAALYTSRPAATRPCGSAALPGGYRTSDLGLPLSCTVTWRGVPWLPQLGWAPAGAAWAVFSVSTQGPLAVVRDGRTVETYDNAPLTLTCGSAPALRVVPAIDSLPLPSEPAGHRRDGISYAGCRIPASGPSGVTLRVSERLLLSDSTTMLPLTWSVPLG